MLLAQHSHFGVKDFRKPRGVVSAGPRTVKRGGPGENIDLRVKNASGDALIDILVSDVRAPVYLTLPDGHVLTPSTPKNEQAEWKTLTPGTDDLDDDFGFGPPLLVGQGTHHVIALTHAAAGLYRVHTDAQATVDTRVTAAFMPAKAMEEMFDSAFGIPPYPTDHVNLIVLPPDIARAGEILRISPGFEGPVDNGTPITIEVRAAYESELAASGITSISKRTDRFPPVSRIVTQDYAKLHSIPYAPPTSGVLYVHFRAAGHMSSGRSFVSETEFRETIVDSVAHLIRLVDDTSKPAPDQRASSLDITAQLEVKMPGEYHMDFVLSDLNGHNLYPKGSAQLGAGSRQLTVSIPAQQMLRLDDGPYKISSLSIRRGQYYTPSEAVQIEGLEFPTAARKRSDWNRGPLYGEDTIRWHKANPSVTNQFSTLQVEWQVVTPGGNCQWYASISPQGGGKLVTSDFSVRDLEPGTHTLAFSFPGAAIAKAGIRIWDWTPSLQCNGSYAATRAPFFYVIIDPTQFH